MKLLSLWSMRDHDNSFYACNIYWYILRFPVKIKVTANPILKLQINQEVG